MSLNSILLEGTLLYKKNENLDFYDNKINDEFILENELCKISIIIKNEKLKNAVNERMKVNNRRIEVRLVGRIEGNINKTYISAEHVEFKQYKRV